MGRISYEKDIDQAIRAFGIASQDLPDATFMIVGDGPERKKLEVLAKELGVDGKIIFTGMLHREDLRDALQANDIFRHSKPEREHARFRDRSHGVRPADRIRKGKRYPRNRAPRQEWPARGTPDHPENLAAAIVRLFSSPAGLQKKGVHHASSRNNIRKKT